MQATKKELRLTGSGGQGIILASIILAEAAIIADKNAVQSQSYGPEARGGVCKAEVIIDDGSIGFTKVMSPTFFLALTQESLDTYAKTLPKNCLIMADDSLSFSDDIDKERLIVVPIIKTAKEKVGKAMTANIVAVGAINAAMEMVSFEQLLEAVKRHVPKGTEELNEKALVEGAKLIEKEVF
jgi:2-oxoglutarate ferredoxin oxidoreductase subunit gamma